MQPVPRIFVSATSRDLRTARGLVSEGLRRMECLPIVQDDFPPDYKSVRDMLRTKISTCNAVVHLAGFYYGAEPQPVLPGPDRRSFTQMEYEIAMELKLPCYVFLCGKDFPFDPHDPEPEDKQQLQLAHRDRLLQRDELFYEFASPEELANRTRELQLSVEGLRKELARERTRRRLTLAVAAVALLVALGGGWMLFGKQKAQETVIVQQGADLAKMQAQLAEFSALVTKVNAAQEQARQAGADDFRRVALQSVAQETGKSVEQVAASIDATVQTAQQVAAAARQQGTPESRQIEADAKLKLAAAHEAAGRYAEALAAYDEGLALLDRAQDTARWAEASAQAGWMERQLERDEAARARHEAALAFVEKQPDFGPTHPTTLRLVDSLSSTLTSLRDFDTAEKLNRRILRACEEKLGPEAPRTLHSLGKLAYALIWKRQQTRPNNASAAEVEAADEALAEGEALVRRALRTSEKISGPDSDQTTELVSTLSLALRLKKDFDGALAAHQRIQNQRVKTLGPEHDLTISSAELLGIAQRDAEDLEGAEATFRRVAAWREKNLGPEHPETIDSLNQLGITLMDAEEHEAAEALYRRGLPIAERQLGPDHSTTMSFVFSMASALRALDRPAEALPLLRRRLAWMTKTRGEDHTSAALAAALLADCMIDADEDAHRAEALKLLRYANAIQAEKLGTDHDLTKDTAKMIKRLEEP